MSEDESKKPKFERKNRRSKSSVFDPEQKAKVIMDSRLPESEKAKYLDRLGLTQVEEKIGVPFNVYARLKKIPAGLQNAMLAYPKAKGVESATQKQWDEIFKEF